MSEHEVTVKTEDMKDMEEMTEYKYLDGAEEAQVQMHGSAMYFSIDWLMGMVRSHGLQDTELGRCFAGALETAHVIEREVLNQQKRLYVYAPQRYLTARAKLDRGVGLLGALPGLEKMKEQGTECQQKMDAYAGVWQKIVAFDKEHWNPYTQRKVFGRHAFSARTASMEEMLRDLKAMEE